MEFFKFLKLVAIFVVIFSLIVGAAVGTYFIITTDFSITNQIGKALGIGKNKRVNALVLGTDEGGLRTDFIMFASYNPSNKKLNMISIPRDTRVPNSIDKKINSLYLKGKEALVIKDVENILDLPIDYYAVINFEGFRKIVDDIGGIPINVPFDMKYPDPYQGLNINISKGYQVLDGAKAEGFVRYRSGYATADLGRIEAQHDFISAAIDQLLRPQNIPKLPSLINTALSNVKTNASTADILKYIDDAVKIDKNSIIMERLPGEPKYIGGVSYYVFDKEKTKKMVERMFYNEEEIDDKSVIERNKNIKVEVFNGTGIPGLASGVADQLREKGFQVLRVDNWDSIVTRTKIYEHNRKIEGVYVKNVIRVGEISAEYTETSNIDITVLLGQDFN